jgi:hypothetical protein
MVYMGAVSMVDMVAVVYVGVVSMVYMGAVSMVDMVAVVSMVDMVSMVSMVDMVAVVYVGAVSMVYVRAVSMVDMPSVPPPPSCLDMRLRSHVEILFPGFMCTTTMTGECIPEVAGVT